MDIQIAAVLSVVWAVIWTPRGSGDVFRVHELLTAHAIYRFTLYFVRQYAAAKLYWIIIYPAFFSPLRKIPGPKDNYPFVGQFVKALNSPNPNDLFLAWHEKWPREPFIRYLGLGNREILVANTPEAYKEILQTHCYDFKRSELLFRLVGEMTGKGILFKEGAEHKRQRRILQESFTLPKLKTIFPVFQEKARALGELFGKSLDEHGKGVVNVIPAYSKLGMDLVGVGILGVELGNLTSSDQKWDFMKCFNYVLSPPPLTALITSINTQVRVREYLPIEANTVYMRATKMIREMALEVVYQRFVDVDQQIRNGWQKPAIPSEGRDLLTMMVQHNREFKDDELSKQDIVEHVLTFITAGYANVSLTSAWTSYVMATRPDAQEKLRREILDLMQKAPRRVPSWDEIDKLHYLNNFIMEVLRPHCPALATYREAIHDMTICNTFIPRGTSILLQLAVTNRSKTIWGPDADEFVPERWDNLKGESANPYAFNTFVNGERICIGKMFSLMEAKAQLVEVVSRFRFVTTPKLEALGRDWPAVQNPSVFLVPKGGLRIGVERI